MTSMLTWQLLAVLLAAALLGLLMGISGMRLHQARQQEAVNKAQKAALEKLKAECSQLNAEKASTKQALESERKLANIARDKHSQLAAQQEALQVHSGLQAKKISKLNAELHAAEEKSIRLERDFASFKASKLREVRMLKANPDEWLDNEELPVLNKKVQRGRRSELIASSRSLLDNPLDSPETPVPDMDQTQPIIASELDIPSLAESELPDSVEELEFELVDTAENRD